MTTGRINQVAIFFLSTPLCTIYADQEKESADCAYHGKLKKLNMQLDINLPYHTTAQHTPHYSPPIAHTDTERETESFYDHVIDFGKLPALPTFHEECFRKIQ